MSSWSYSDLKKQYGEDKALEMLAGQKGYGQYQPDTWVKPHTPHEDGIDRCPLCGKSVNSTSSCGPAVGQGRYVDAELAFA